TKKAVKSPNLVKKTNHTVHRTRAAQTTRTPHGLAIQKLHKEKIQNQPPTPTGHKRRLAKLEDLNQYAQTT
ncbi:hypothetical protein, partial [Corynebacterium sp. HMSC034H07]|uniref:hypothetical protein n=1 Tax=Corynebacterium sp. HMSC034H07 TaxID=1739512 RepID=UPI001E3885EC